MNDNNDPRPESVRKAVEHLRKAAERYEWEGYNELVDRVNSAVGHTLLEKYGPEPLPEPDPVPDVKFDIELLARLLSSFRNSYGSIKSDYLREAKIATPRRFDIGRRRERLRGSYGPEIYSLLWFPYTLTREQRRAVETYDEDVEWMIIDEVQVTWTPNVERLP